MDDATDDQAKVEAEKGDDDFRLTPFLIELGVYAVLVTLYFLLVLHFMGDWLKELYDHQRWTYAFVGLAVVVVQAAVLEIVTGKLLSFFRSRTK